MSLVNTVVGTCLSIVQRNDTETLTTEKEIHRCCAEPETTGRGRSHVWYAAYKRGYVENHKTDGKFVRMLTRIKIHMNASHSTKIYIEWPRKL